MDITIIDEIVKWIPFKSLRNNLREYMYFQHGLRDEIRELINLKYIPIAEHDFELIKSFRKYVEKDNNFENKYLNLTKGLDKESLNFVSHIFSKITNYKNINDPVYFEYFYLKELNDLWSKHSSKIINIKNRYYAYENYILPINQFEESIFFEKMGLSNFTNLASIKDKSIIDAGGFIGDSAIILADYTNKNVYSFEPLTSNYNMMLKTIKLNNKNDKIIPVKYALGNNNSNIEISSNDEISSGFNLNYNNNQLQSDKKEIISTITLDEFVENNNIEVGLIKTDVEGFEQKLLNGAMETIKNQRPNLIISIYHNYDDFLEIKPMIENLNLGYRFKIPKVINGGILLETKLLAECC